MNENETKERMAVVSVNYTNFYMPSHMAPHFIEYLTRNGIQLIDDRHATMPKLSPIEPSLEYMNAVELHEMTEREKKLEEELKEKTNYWLSTHTRLEEAQKELAELRKAQTSTSTSVEGE